MSEDFERREADQIEGVAPPETRNLVGHDIAYDRLFQAIEAARIPGAVLLHGPRGIGKATFAFSLAREVFTRTSDEDPARIAAQVAAMSHPNLFVLRRAKDTAGSSEKFFSAIRVDDVRATRAALNRTRGRAGYRVCVIDSVDDCNANSANALLKTLEEPPAETLFVVISHRPGGLLPTIRSRCQSIGLRPLAPDAVHGILAAGSPNTDSEALERATQLAEGRPRRGFETLLLAQGDLLDAVMTWLSDPAPQPVRAHLILADALAGSKGAELDFAQTLMRDWIAAEANEAARAGGSSRMRLASANELWDKANALFADADVYNLDRRQTLVAVFDAIRGHVRKTSSVATEYS